MPFNRTSAFGIDTQPGYMAFIAVLLDGFAIVLTWVMIRQTNVPWGAWLMPLLWVLVSLRFWYIATKKWRWGKKYQRATGKNPWK